MEAEVLLSVFRTTPTPSLLLLANSNEFRVFEVNDAFLRCSFLSREEILGKSIFDVLPPVDREPTDQSELQSLLKNVKEKKRAHYLPPERFQVPRAPGRGFATRYFTSKSTPILNGGQEISFILHTLEEVDVRDVGEGIMSLSGNEQELIHYKALFEQNPDAVFSMNRHGFYTSVNKAATDIMGVSAEAFVTKHFSEFVPESDVERVEKYISDCINGHPSSWEVSAMNAYKKMLRLAVTIMPIVYDGRIDGIYGIVKDITASYNLEREKQLIGKITDALGSEASLSNSLQKVLGEVCSYAGLEAAEIWLPSIDDQELHLEAWFKKHGEMKVLETDFSKDNKSLIGRAWTDKRTTFLDKIQTSKDYVRPEFARVNGLNSGVCYPVVIHDQAVAVLAMYSTENAITADPLGTSVLHQLGTHIQKKRAEQELNQYFLMSPDMICFIGGDGFLKKLNPAFEGVLGYSEEEFLSRPFVEFVHEEDRAATLQELDRIREGISSPIFINRCLTKTGEIRWLSWTSTFLAQQRVTLAIARDITQSQELQQTIELQQRRFTKLFHEAPVSMCILKGKDHVFESANSRYYELTARTPEIIGKTVREVFPELADKGYYEWLDQVYESGETSNWTETNLSVVTDTGNLKESYISFMYQPYLNYEGKPEGIFVFAVDVTQQVVARKKIQERKRQYIDLIENLPVAIYTTDATGAVQVYNKAAVKLWGCEPVDGAMVWNPKVEVLGTDKSPIAFEDLPMARALRNGQTSPLSEIVIRTADNQYRTVVPYTIQSFNSEKELTGSINVLIDITERTLVEDELRKLSLVATKTNNIVVITNTSGIIEWVNEAFCSFFGFSREEVLGKKPSYVFYELNPNYSSIPPNSSIPFLEQKELMAQLFHGELEYRSVHRGVIWMEVNGQPLFDARGEVSHYVVIAVDITEKKKSFEKLKNSKNEIKRFARQLNSILEEERARIAREFHDEFGQQLTGLRMSLSALNRTAGTKASQEIIEPMLDDVDEIIQHIRRFATELRPAILDTLGLFPALEWLIKDFEKKTGVKALLKMDVREHCSFEKNLSICTFRICQEALTNIAKHSAATKVWVEIVQGEELILTITDNGKGMRNEQISDPLSMGLLGMRERAHLVGGEVSIFSDSNKQTRVEFTVKLYPSINVFSD